MGEFSDAAVPASQADHYWLGTASTPTPRPGSHTPMPGMGPVTPATPLHGTKTKVARWASATKTSTSTNWSSNNAISVAPAGQEHLFEGKVEILDRKTWKSVHAAVDALNKGVLVVEAGYCMVFSESCKLYFILRRDDKELDALTALPPDLFRGCALPSRGGLAQLASAKDNAAPGPGAMEFQAVAVTPMATSSKSKPPICPSSPSKLPARSTAVVAPTRLVKTDDAARIPANAAAARKEWSKDRSVAVGTEGCSLESLLEGDADILFLGKSRWSSVSEVVTALSEGLLAAEGGFCVVFSTARKSYQLVWRSDRDTELPKLLPHPVSSCQPLVTSSATPKRSHSSSQLHYPILSVVPSRTCSPIRRRPEESTDQLASPVARLANESGLGPERFPSPTRRGSAPPAVFAPLIVNEAVQQMKVCHTFESQEQGQVRISMSPQRSSVPMVEGPVDQVSTCGLKVLAPTPPEIAPLSRKIYDLLPPGSAQNPQAPPEAPALCKTPQDFELPSALAPVLLESPSSCAPVQTNKAEGGLEVLELHFVNEMDLTRPALQVQLFNKLKLAPDTMVEELAQSGGLNQGVWTLHDNSVQPERHLVLKLVQRERREGELLEKIAREHPSLVQDPDLAFPVKIFKCIGDDASVQYDLVVMPKAQGANLGIIIGNMWWTNQVPALMQIIEKVGTCLAGFHQRYDNNQHGDFQPSNVLHDEAEDKITFIDLNGIGPEGSCLDNDVEHFVEALRLMSKAYGPSFFEESVNRFHVGYAKCSPRSDSSKHS